MILLFNFTTI